MTDVVAADFGGVVAGGASDDELGEVARTFDKASASARERLARLEHRDAVLRRALADFTHDLRTPLATLKLSASGLPASTAASTIRSELGFLEGMTANFEAILDKGDEGDLSTRVSVVELAERVEHRFSPLAKDRGLTFEVAFPDEALVVQADGVALERAVSNLIHNAIRFAAGHVVLVVFRDKDEVRLEVRDDGPGLGAVSGRAAERGRRGQRAQGEGFGLGLAIAEASARRFGGRLELENTDEGGALAAIVLPHAPAVSVSQGGGTKFEGCPSKEAS
jgi:signal transduction histidine kinase